MSDKIKCPGCKKSIKKTARFCGYCGAKIETEEMLETPAVSDTSVILPEAEYEDVSAVLPVLDNTVPAETDTETLSMPVEEVSAEADGLLCTACGAKVRAGAKFCGICGSDSLVSAETPAETSFEEAIPAEVMPEETVPEVPVLTLEEETFVPETERTTDVSLPREEESEESFGMICTYCGAKMRAGAKFCGVCGGDSLMDERMLEEDPAGSPAPKPEPMPVEPAVKGFRPANVDDLGI